MIIKRLLLISFILISLNCNGFSCEKTGNTTVWNYMNKWFKKLDSQLAFLNKISAHLAWDMATEKTNDTLINRGLQISISKSNLRHQSCTRYVTITNTVEERIMYLLCRGPNFTTNQIIEMSLLMDKLSQIYVQAKFCIDKSHWLYDILKEEYGETDEICLQGEQDFDKLMKRKSLSSEDLYWIWDSWHSIGKDLKPIYPILVNLMNQGAKANLYSDIGEVWREELEIPNLEEYVFGLYKEVQPLYEMLHAVVRHKLFIKYGPGVIDPAGLIPAHLLGNLWAQDWSSLLDLFFSLEEDVDENISKKKWNPTDMVEIAEDFYASLGFPRMTEKFWKYSKIDGTNSSMCHGSAANMFSKNDYRILLCAELNMEDFYVIHHEMGHIEYYMAYKDLPTIFQDGANSAIQESIGDAIMTGVMVPHHLHRLGLIKEDRLYNESLDIILLMRQALSKIPQISYGLMLDHYRWNIFSGKIQESDYNSAFWSVNRNIRGIEPFENRDGPEFFDAGAKFHIADNTPYIRYFLASFIQVDIFKSLCRWSLYAKFSKTPLPFPLHRCDIYGSRHAGKQLKSMMSYGSSRHWTKIYKFLTGRKHISSKPLIDYYRPVYKWLKNYIAKHNIPVGW